tara:strand:- start:32 stop:229 length:198 start_codon:yes stop_codon:yes gene_type:complete
MLVAVAVDWKARERKVLAALAVVAQEIMVLAQTARAVRLTLVEEVAVQAKELAVRQLMEVQAAQA